MDTPTESDFTDRFGADHLKEIADRDGDDVADSGVFTAHAADINSRARSMVGRRHAMPLATTPQWMIAAQLDMVAFSIAKESRSSLMEEHRLAAEKAEAMFMEVATGDRVLGLDEEPESLHDPTMEGVERQFSTDLTEGLF